VQFSMEFAAAQKDADKRIILENEKLLHSEDEPPGSTVSATLPKEWWRKSASAFQQVCTFLRTHFP
jgi:hypothetical protein